MVSILTHTHTHTHCRAAQAGNIQVVLKLLKEFGATPLVNDIHTGESVLHITCKNKSKLRFFFTKMHPNLLKVSDNNGAHPLHVACSRNDISFISWLFKNILAEDSAMDEIKSPSALSVRRTVSLPDITRNVSHHSDQPTLAIARPMVGPQRSLFSPQINQVQQHSRFSHDVTDAELIEENCKKFPCDTDKWGRHRTVTEGPESSEVTNSSLKLNSPSSTSGNSSSGEKLDSISSGSKTQLVQLFVNGEESHALGHSEQLMNENQLLNLVTILEESPLKIVDLVEIKPFSMTMKGESIFHILAKKGYTQLLALILKVAEFVQGIIDLKVLVVHDQCNKSLPIEEAIRAKNIDCVRIIIHFLSIAGLLPELLGNPLLFKRAVLTEELDIVKVLIEYGFHKGLSPAIFLAIIRRKCDAILRVLLYYQTQVVNALQFSCIQHGRRRTLDRGGIKWVGLQLDHIDSSWLYDCCSAVDSVSKMFNHMQELLTVDDNHYFFQQLGCECLHYFSKAITSPRSMHTSHHLTQITEVDLSENQLVDVPVELFQLPSLDTLQLSHNKLTSLPSSDNPWERLYTSHVSKLKLDGNRLRTLPEGLFRDLANSLTKLSVECNSLQDLPPGLWIIPKLKVLKLAWNNLSRLHYLSSQQYFNDPGLTETVINSFTVDKGVLKCTQSFKNEDIEEYLIKLADYHYTVCATKFSACQFNESVMDEIMAIHHCRMRFFHQSRESEEHCPISNPMIQGQPLFPTNIEEESDSPLSIPNNLEIVDLSHNSFNEIPWDLPCIAPQLKKLNLQNNQIQVLDLVHSMPYCLESLKLDNNQISNLEKHRPMSLPCGHPLRLLALPKGNEYCQHCKHSTLDHLRCLFLNHNELTKFPVVKVISDHSFNPESPSYDHGSFDCLPFYPNLSILSLEANKFTHFPKHLHHLTQLRSVNLSHNGFHELPPEAGLINTWNLKMDGMYIKNIPPHLLQKPTPELLLSYLKALLQKLV